MAKLAKLEKELKKRIVEMLITNDVPAKIYKNSIFIDTLVDIWITYSIDFGVLMDVTDECYEDGQFDSALKRAGFDPDGDSYNE